jgi:flagellar basal body-associated protein FliL
MAEKEKKEPSKKEAENKEAQPAAKVSNSAQYIRIGIIAGTVLINIILAVGLTMYLKKMMHKNDPEVKKEQAAQKIAEEELEKKTAVGKISDPLEMVVNLAPPDQDTYLKAGICVEYENLPEVEAMLLERKLKIKAICLEILADKNREELQRPDAKSIMCKHILKKINAIMPRENVVMNVYFSEFIIQ